MSSREPRSRWHAQKGVAPCLCGIVHQYMYICAFIGQTRAVCLAAPVGMVRWPVSRGRAPAVKRRDQVRPLEVAASKCAA